MLQQIMMASLLIALFLLIRILSDRYVARWRIRQKAGGMRSGCMARPCGDCEQEAHTNKTTN